MTHRPLPDTIRSRDHDRVAVLELDHPDRSMNVVDERVLSDLGRHFTAVLDDDSIDALVLTSAKKGSFGAGADVSWLPELAARPDAAEFLAGVHDLMLRVVRSPKPVVAALNGAAFGGALELVLAAHAIVAVPEAVVGLPEVTLELLPGGGGTQLLGRWVATEDWVELLVSGGRLNADQARDRGLVTEVVAADGLLEAALRHAARLVADPRSRTGRSHDAEAGAALVARVREERANSRAGLTPAVERILDCLAVGITEGIEAGLAAERDSFLALLRSPRARAAIHLFQAEADIKRRSRGADGRAERLGVVGGGQMGSGIAATAVSRGLSALVRDVSAESLDRSRAYLDRVLARSAPEDGADPRAERWRGTTGWDGFAETDAVVEAVFELPELKNEILTTVSGLVGEQTLLATNTSAISIRSLAASVRAPERFLGMHFFSPVERMPLVELIPHEGTSAETLARAAALGRRLGKVPVVVGDAPGFFTSRVYARWLIEGVRLLLEGVRPGVVDSAAKAVGFPVGPLQAHDEAGVELVVQASITQVAENVMTDRIDVAAVRKALETLLEAGVRGRRQGLGFYRYADGRRVGPNDEVLDVLGVAPVDADAAAAGERLLLAFASECFLCWDDGTLCHPDDGDVASVLGIGFPRALGGPFHWADEVGAARVVERLAAAGGAEFPAGAALEALAAEGGRFADAARRPAPFTEPEGESA
ncbi:hypothetical protein FOF52_14890 [Thermobifida alba]|uniref:enoyl-CoA hydratase n=1 Tax=Thermobifida alba TaxID=53522 RepID=A0ABY4L425_THEAE|nr:3-hydroxyacyl-CoA dehydrogenase NAD-binding domain-containing protein [Thermobifida alba]UPT22090.1 hypothetical protein FOF52_14890 [Thermobifida alba]